MSEKLYALLLKLYPYHFRQAYAGEMLRLVRERASSENGFLSSLRLWLDLLLDLAISLPRQYSNMLTMPVIAAQSLNSKRSFQLPGERSLNPAFLCLGGTLTAALFWACVFVVEQHGATRFPSLFPAPLLRKLAQSTDAAARYSYEEGAGVRSSAVNSAAGDVSGHSVSAGAHSFCITAKQDIQGNSIQPLFAFRFAPSGASGIALIDGKVVKRFKNEQSLSIRAHVFAGDHQFVLHLDGPAGTTFMFRNGDLEYCRAK